MKATILIAALMFLMIGCDKSDFEFEDKYDKSYKSWLAFKNSVDNSYTYKVTKTSWGLSAETIITVSNGVIIRREFTLTPKEGLDIEIPKEDLEWVETEGEIGSKKDTSASEAITLDEVYEIAKNDWLKKRKNTQTFFEAENNGIISLSGYRENNCADDCFIGIYISSVDILK